jgi:di/tricarboxylate transporter
MVNHEHTGGMALADGFAKSGLSAYMTHHLRSLGDFPPYLMLILICCLILFITELTSNVATITLALPILASMAVTVGQNPLLLMVPGTICSSFAFMLPVGTL